MTNSPSPPLTDERMAEIREWRDLVGDGEWRDLASSGKSGQVGLYSALADAIGEIGRLRAERDELLAELAAVRDRGPLTCGASHANDLGAIGPCVLRLNHDGPVHQDAAGAQWWATTKYAVGANSED